MKIEIQIQDSNVVEVFDELLGGIKAIRGNRTLKKGEITLLYYVDSSRVEINLEGINGVYTAKVGSNSREAREKIENLLNEKYGNNK